MLDLVLELEQTIYLNRMKTEQNRKQVDFNVRRIICIYMCSSLMDSQLAAPSLLVVLLFVSSLQV